MAFVEHPRIRPGTLEDRLFQAQITKAAVAGNTLVVLPTGLGKTAIAIRVIAEYLRREPTRSVLVMAPTRPLVMQHARSMETTLFAPPVVELTGTVGREKRQEKIAPPQLVVATPQVIANDLERGTLSLSDFSLLVFDEAHRAVGDYPYVSIGRANRDGPNLPVLALTASPGSQRQRVQEVWANLGITKFETRSTDDPDVRPYHHHIGYELVELPVPAEVRRLADLLQNVGKVQVAKLQSFGLLREGNPGRRELLDLGSHLRREIDAARRRNERPAASVWAAVTAQTVAMKALHGAELIESQGVDSLRDYLGRQAERKNGRVTPAQRVFLTDPDVVRAKELLESTEVEHPKIAKVVEIVRAELGGGRVSKVLVFTQYRQTADTLVRELSSLNDPSIRPARFVGQATAQGDEGLTQKEQGQLLDDFRDGKVNCLVATSVAEEGLDVPSTDLVIFYEPVADVIRTIQRRGRTGRGRHGRVLVLAAQGSRDLGLFRAARRREARMHEMLEEIQELARKGQLSSNVPIRTTQRSLSEFGV